MGETNELNELLTSQWYLLDQPWCPSTHAGLNILSGSPDPHVGIPVACTEDVIADNYDDATAREIARHIVKLHNASLEAG